MHISNAMLSQDWTIVLNVYDHADTYISFWGGRVVTALGYEGSIGLWKLIDGTGYEYMGPDAEHPERKLVYDKIWTLVEKSCQQDDKLEAPGILNRITSIFLRIREFSAQFCFYATASDHVPSKEHNYKL